MSLTIFRTLFFCLVPLGVFILIKAIRMLKDIFNGEVIAEKPFTEKEIHFEVKKKGVYAVWQKGRLFRRTPVDRFALKLFSVPSGEPVPIDASVFRPHSSSLDTARIEMNRFFAEPGHYRLQIVEGSSVSLFERLLFELFPGKPVDYSQYFLQVRESRSAYYMVAAIPLFILCAFCIMGGFVAGFMAPYILTDLGIPFNP
ncbi:hypothetical protein ABDD95_06530 [Mucilaginibacter sp. PAMB04274]|uniref:hypothetical protein n=1 Tax=Mucilaginibacter sp. PAMB04274 TaxID=3138568 RepID=UPI0031F62A75